MFKKVLLAAIAVLFMSAVRTSFAEEVSLVVTGNGDNATSEISQTTQSSTNSTQANNSQIINEVNTSSNTGNNTVNENTGDGKIVTGDIHENISIQNENINSNSSTLSNCCVGSQSQIVSGNGNNTQNSISSNNVSNLHANQTNTAHISSGINSTNNTGSNYASENGGQVIITTGSIYSSLDITNRNINSNSSNISSGFSLSNAIIKNNGADSENRITIKNIYGNDIVVLNNAYIDNDVVQDNNTGKNFSSKNNGNVFIGTGDIIVKTNILNENINANITNVECNNCPKKTPEKPKTPVVSPPNAPGNNGGNGGGGNGKGGNGNGGDTLGARTGNLLPETGSPWMIVLSLIGFLTMLTGVFLRYHTGASPPAIA